MLAVVKAKPAVAANAASLGAIAIKVSSIDELSKALAAARENDRTTVIQIETDPGVPAPSSQAWWDVPVAEVAGLASTRDARAAYEKHKERQRPYL